MKDLLRYFHESVQTVEDVEQLKKKILELAVRGKLVKQDPNDEPASVLLERIKEEKERLIKEKKIRKSKPLSPITPDEIPYELPKGWEWIRLGDIISIISGVTYKKNQVTTEGYGNTRILRGGNILNNKLVLHEDDYFLTSELISEEKLIRKGDIIVVASTGSKDVIGKPAYITEQFNSVAIGAFLRIIRPFNVLMSGFLSKYFFSDIYRSAIRDLVRGTNINNIKNKYLEELFIGIPPLKEQKRIIEKVNELMVLCDQLANDLRQKVETSSSFNKSVFIRIQDPSNLNPLKNVNFAIEHINDLLQTKDDVELFRNSVLSLATQGKLVPQDPTDEPAFVLLEKIQKEKERLVKEKIIKKVKPLPPITSDEIPYTLPAGWEWVRVAQLVYAIGGSTPSKGRSDYWNKGHILWVSPKDMKSMLICDSKDKITNLALETTNLTLIPKNSVLIVVRSGILKRMLPVALTAEECTINQDIKALISPFTEINNYLYWLIRGNERRILNEVSKTGTTVDRIIFDEFMNMIFPLPPLNEQKRIILKIQQIMKYCDKFEQQIEKFNKDKNLLAQTVMKSR